MLNSKGNNWGSEVVSMLQVQFEHIKGTKNILADHLSRLKSMGLYDALSPEAHGLECGHVVFEPIPPVQINEIQQTEQHVSDPVVSLQYVKKEIKITSIG